MAFGRQKTQDSPENESQDKRNFFPTTTIPLTIGAKRTIWLLPDNKDPKYPEAETAVYCYWLPVTIDGKRTKPNGDALRRRIFFDRAAKDTFFAGNPSVIFRNFFNVYDVTPVIVVQNDPSDPEVVELAYPTADRKYVTGFGDKLTVHTGKAVANKRVMILEAPYGLLTDIEGRVDIDTDSEGNPLELLNMEIDFIPRIDPKDPKGRKWIYSCGARELTTTDRSYYDLPRYNVSEAFAPYPAEAIQALIDGEDFNEVVKNYKINRIPKLVKPVTEEPF